MQPSDSGPAAFGEVEVVVSVVEAVERELEALGSADSSLGAGALVLAARLDDPGTLASAVPSCQRELRETMAALRSAVGSGSDRMTRFERLRAVGA